MKIKIASADSIIIYFGDKISTDIFKNVNNLYKHLLKSNIKGILEIIPSYTSIFIRYDIFVYDFLSIKTFILNIKNIKDIETQSQNIITIDAYYAKKVGFDLENISKQTNLSINEIMNLHSNKIYDIYAIGFLPGFAYMANVDKQIRVPRLKSPRKLVPKGSVSIANEQTSIYPQNSPGGWNIIARTTFTLFDKNLENLSPLKVGDKIKFNPISKEEFLKQGGIL